MLSLRRFVHAIVLLPAGLAIAADFDGSKPLLCASQQVADVTGPRSVATGMPEEMGAPSFMRIDFQKKTISGPKRITPIRTLDRDDERMLLQGTELGMGWTLAVAAQDGKMSGSLVDEGGAIVIFGSCMPQ